MQKTNKQKTDQYAVEKQIFHHCIDNVQDCIRQMPNNESLVPV